MGYFDDAKASREEENTLEHSSGAWKKHKYIQKIGEGANAVYKYAKKAGKEAKDAAEQINSNFRNATGLVDRDALKEAEKHAKYTNDKYNALDSYSGLAKDSSIMKNAKYDADRANKYRDAWREDYAKTPAGKLSSAGSKTKSTVDKGKSMLKDFFTPKTKVTASSNLTGKETINTKPAEKVTLKKNKLSFKKK